MTQENTKESIGLTAFHRTQFPNDQIQLYQGQIQIESDWLKANDEGEIVATWLPEPEIVARVVKPHLIRGHAFTAREETPMRIGILRDGQWHFGESVFRSIETRGDGAVRVRVISLKCSGARNEIAFHVPNFPECIGAPIHFGNDIIFGRIELLSEQWQVTIDPTLDTHKLIEALKGTSGYAITHSGRLRRSDGMSFSGDAADTVLLALYYFLSFASGRWTGPYLDVFISQGEKLLPMWEQPQLLDPQGALTGFSWLPALAEAAALAEAWPGFLRLWADNAWNETLRVALTWFIEAASGRFIESQLILGQVGLELLAWVKLVEQDQTVSPASFRKSTAADHVSHLLADSGIPMVIPLYLSELTRHAKSNTIKDGPSAITWFRNKIVHPTKLSTVTTTNFHARVEAWNLMLWYFQLVLLKLCDYQGNYHSWVAPLQPPSKVPWAL